MKHLLAIIFFFFFSTIYAQPGSNDPTFNLTNNCSDTIHGRGLGSTCAMQTDGKCIVASPITGTYNGINTNYIFRLNLDGNLDTTFNPGSGFNNAVYAIAIQQDGKIVVAGMFTSFNNTARNRIVRLNEDGSLDLSFNIGSGFNNQAKTIAIQNDGKIIVGGTFISYNGTPVNYMVRLNANGSIDPTFNVGTGGYLINSISLQDDGKVILGGTFLSFNGSTSKRIVRLNSNGSLDNTFNTGIGFNANVNVTCILPDGKILVGGVFSNFNGTVVNTILRLNTDGTLDNTFTPSGLVGGVNSIKVQIDSKIIVGGLSGNILQQPIIRLNSNGTFDNSFIPMNNTPYVPLNSSLAVQFIQSDGKIIITNLGPMNSPQTRNGLTRLNADGSYDLNFNPPSWNLFTSSLMDTGPIIDYVSSISIQPDGKIITAGRLTRLNNPNNNFATAGYNVVRLNDDGTIDNSFYNNIPIFSDDVLTSAIQSDGKIVVGGAFQNVGYPSNGNPNNNRIARLNSNGFLDSTFNIVGTGFNSTVKSVAIQNDGKIIVGGAFISYNGITRKYIARLNSDGTLDQTFTSPGSGFNGSINSISIQNDGQLIIGGEFTSFNGTPVGKIARLNVDGTLDTSFNTSSPLSFLYGFSDHVLTTKIQPDGKIIVGGNFNNFNTSYRGKIARLNSNGSLDASFDPAGNGFNGSYVCALSIQNDGKIIAGGVFYTFNFISRTRIARLNSDGSLDANFNPGSGFINYFDIGQSSKVYSTAIQQDGRIIVGGDFGFYNGICRTKIARLIGNCITPSPVSASSQSFCNSATVGNLVANGSNVQWYSNETGGTSLPLTTMLTNSTYYASQTITGCESPVRTAVFVQINSISAPNGLATQVFCAGANISNLVAIGSNIQWYSSSTGVNPIQPTTALVNGLIYYAAQTVSGCVSSSRLAVNVIINSTSAPTGAATQSFCAGATVTNLVAVGNNIQWYSTLTGGNLLQPNTALVNGISYYAAQTVSGCVSSTRLVVNAIINNTSAPTGIANQTVCAGSTIINLVANGTAIQWYSIPSGGSPLLASTLLLNGTTYYATQTLSGCESVNRLAVAITINPSNIVNVNGNTLIAEAQGLTYQWLDCDNNLVPIPGESQNSYTPLITGNYAVQISDGNCSAVSSCIQINVSQLGFPVNQTNSPFINLYPNPSDGKVFIETSIIGYYKLLNYLSQVVLTFKLESDSKIEIDMTGFAKGVYYIIVPDFKMSPIKLIYN